MNRLLDKWKKKTGHVTEWAKFWDSNTGKEGLRVLIEEARTGVEPATIEASALEGSRRKGMDKVVDRILDMCSSHIEKPLPMQPFEHLGVKQRKN